MNPRGSNKHDTTTGLWENCECSGNAIKGADDAAGITSPDSGEKSDGSMRRGVIRGPGEVQINSGDLPGLEFVLTRGVIKGAVISRVGSS